MKRQREKVIFEKFIKDTEKYLDDKKAKEMIEEVFKKNNSEQTDKK